MVKNTTHVTGNKSIHMRRISAIRFNYGSKRTAHVRAGTAYYSLPPPHRLSQSHSILDIQHIDDSDCIGDSPT